MGCRPTSGDANRAGDNKKSQVGIPPDRVSCKENSGGKADFRGAQENRRCQTSAEKQKNLSLTPEPRSFIRLVTAPSLPRYLGLKSLKTTSITVSFPSLSCIIACSTAVLI